MKFYLDTSALYHINKIPEKVLKESFYSIFGLLEIVAGVNSDNFDKRRAILGSVKNLMIQQDDTFPEQLIFRAFDSCEKYDYIENRNQGLNIIVQEIVDCASFADFQTVTKLKNKEFDFNYFVNRDVFYSENFLESTTRGNELIATELKDAEAKKIVELNDNIYNLNSRRSVIDFLAKSSVNSSITILALAQSVLNMLNEHPTDSEVEKIYNSYNGLINIFVEGMSAYSSNQIINNWVPGKNDSQDLIHMLYLRNISDIRIVSNDNLFIKCIPNKTITVDALTMKIS